MLKCTMHFHKPAFLMIGLPNHDETLIFSLTKVTKLWSYGRRHRTTDGKKSPGKNEVEEKSKKSDYSLSLGASSQPWFSPIIGVSCTPNPLLIPAAARIASSGSGSSQRQQPSVLLVNVLTTRPLCSIRDRDSRVVFIWGWPGVKIRRAYLNCEGV